MAVTPESELVVAPAGYSLAPTMKALSRARRISSGGIASVKYNVIKGSNLAPLGTAATMRSRYAAAAATVVTGGLRFGMMIARANCFAVKGSTELSAAPSRTCKCQSSGRRNVSVTFIGLEKYLSRDIDIRAKQNSPRWDRDRSFAYNSQRASATS